MGLCDDLVKVCLRRNNGNKDETVQELTDMVRDLYNGCFPEDILFESGLEPDYELDLIHLADLVQEDLDVEDADEITSDQITDYIKRYFDAHI
jgi:hypothetical protein